MNNTLPNIERSAMVGQKVLLKAFLDEVWTGGNISGIDRYIAPSYIVHHDVGDPWHGQTLDQNGFRDRLIRSRAPFPDQAFTVQHMVEEGNTVAVSWLWQGTHLADLAGFKASGKVIRMSGITLYDFTGGLLSGHWQLTDRLGVYQQLMANQ